MKELKEALNWLLEAFRLWAQCLARLVPLLNGLLQEESDEARLSAATQIGVTSSLISLVVSIPLHKWEGIEWNNVGFHVADWTITILLLLAAAFTVHRLLLMLKLESRFVITLVLYATIVMIWSPVLTVLWMLILIYSRELLIYSRELIPGNLEALALTGTIILGILFVLVLLLCVVLALFAESITKAYGNNRFQSYSAVAAAALVIAVIGGTISSKLHGFAVLSFAHH